MKKFTTLYTASIIRNAKTGKEAKILKVRKDGTKRVFFRPVTEVDGEEIKIGSTLWARLSEAETVAKQYLNRE